MELSPTKLTELWRTMVLIRRFEEAVGEAYTAGKIPGFIHLSIGQEAVAAGVCSALREDDYIYVSHRGHGQCLAKGADVRRMMAELYGKDTGYCRGRGGSMHIAAYECGVLGANAIVGGNFPLAVGAAFAIQTIGGDEVVVVFFGEGAVNEGSFHESMNLAALWRLPIIFVCENNGYAQFTPAAAEHANLEIYRHADAYSMNGVRLDGNDAAAVYAAAHESIEQARAGAGPVLIECLTYRWRGHYEGDPERYRTSDETEEWQQKDPIARLEQQLLDDGYLTDDDVSAWTGDVEDKVAAAAQYADESAVPIAEVALREVYVR